MSADNWDYCPRCKKNAVAADLALEQRIIAEYGKLPIDKWEELKLTERAEPALQTMMREDYELGIKYDGSGFYVIYKAYCTTAGCGFRHEYRHEEAIVI